MDTDTDWIFGGTFIACFSIIGCGVAAWVYKECRNKPTIKQSPSMENLAAIVIEDPSN